MIFHETGVEGVFLVEPELIEDERGFFARTWCRDELDRMELESNVAQCSISFNRYEGTLRGMHYQTAPDEEVKLVRCTRGSVYDVALDLREDSESYLMSVGFELSADNRRMLYIPKGCAHGFLTLRDDTEVEYTISAPYAPASQRGVRWNDPAFAIAWPRPVRIIKERDASYPDFPK